MLIIVMTVWLADSHGDEDHDVLPHDHGMAFDGGEEKLLEREG